MLSAAAFGSCGIETISSYIEGAPRFQSDLLFKGTDSEETNLLYQGIDVFYKIYARAADAEKDKSELQKRQTNNIVPGSQVKSFLQNSLKYRRLKGNIPSLARPSDPETVFEIKLSDDRKNVDISSALFSRNMSTNRTFADKPNSADDDYLYHETPDQEGYTIQFFGCSYGTNFAGGDPDVYSDAVYLGRIRLLLE